MANVMTLIGFRTIAPRALVAASVALLAGGCNTNGTGGGSTFPKTVAWQPFQVANNASGRPTVVATADFNADGRVDVLAAFAAVNAQPATLAIFFQNFQNNNINWIRVIIGQNAEAADILGLAIADLDSNGRLDVIAGANGRVLLFRSPADPTQAIGWQSFTIAQSDAAGLGQYRDVAVGQVDAQFGLDIVAANETAGRIMFFASPLPPLNPANPGQGWTRFDIDAATRTGAVGIIADDVNADGRLDVISSAPGEANARLAWYRNPGGASQTPWSKFPIGNMRSATRIALGDLDRDGRFDLIGTNPAAKTAPNANDGIQVGWYHKPADPTAPWSGFVLAQYNTASPTDVAVADVDANGNPDVIVSTQTPGTLRWFSRRQNIQQDWIENNLADVQANVLRIALGDIDLDARPDVIAAQRAASDVNDSVTWYLNPE